MHPQGNDHSEPGSACSVPQEEATAGTPQIPAPNQGSGEHTRISHLPESKTSFFFLSWNSGVRGYLRFEGEHSQESQDGTPLC